MANRDPASTQTTGTGAELELFARIVCGVDSSEASTEAVRQVMRLAPAGLEPTLIAVSESRLAVHAGMHAPRRAAEIEAEAQQALAAARAVAVGSRTRLVQGRAAETLLRVLTEESATLVCIGSHDHRRITGVFLGSVTTLMLHSAPCSVLVARPRASAGEFPRSIVVGVDGSVESLRVAVVAGELGERLGVPATFLVATGGRSTEIDAAALDRSGLDLTYSDAHPVTALTDAARETDLVILGSRGLSGLQALGSVSERVAHRAASSLLVVRTSN